MPKFFYIRNKGRELFRLNKDLAREWAYWLTALLVGCLAAWLMGCQGAVQPIERSAVPAITNAQAAVATVKVEATKTAAALQAATAAPDLPAAKVEVAKAHASNNAVLVAAGGAAVDLAQAKPLAQAHEKNEAAAVRELAESASPAKDRLLWAAGALAGLGLLAVAAAVYFRSELAAVVAGVALAGAGCAWWIAEHLRLVGWAIGISLLALALSGGAYLWWRSNQANKAQARALEAKAKTSAEALWGVFHAAASPVVSGGKNMLDVASDDFWHFLESNLGDDEFAALKEYRSKIQDK